MRRIVCFVVACIFSGPAVAQTFDNIRSVQEGTRIIVLYDLISPNPNAIFTVALYSSHNNFSSPVLSVTGDIGKGQKPGKNKRVEWDLRTDLQSFRGQLAIELGGVPEALKLEFRQPFLSKKAKQGKSVIISWQGGTDHPNVKLDVYRDGRLVTALGERKNTGSYQWAVPPDIEKGNNFIIRLSSGNEHVDSLPFDIKGKTPMWAKIAPLVVGVGVITYMLFDKLPKAPEPN
jgi:hypothetical protein